MKTIKIVIISKKLMPWLAVMMTFLLLVSTAILIQFRNTPTHVFVDPHSGIIVIDAGHGGIDGGAYKDGVLEKEINLDISKRLRFYLKQKGYQVIMTREEDESLDHLSETGGNKHQRDLNSRVNIINGNNAQLYLSIHGNFQPKNSKADGSIVFYSDKFPQNKTLAYCIQRSLNNITIDGKKRTIHDPQVGNYFLLSYSKIPGTLVEIAFISNREERRQLMKDSFREDIARSIASGVEQYLNEQKRVFNPAQ